MFVPGFFTHGLYIPDEVRYAEVAREMTTVEGAWILPRLNGDVYSEKPPLFFWLVALLGLALGGNFSAPPFILSALAGLGTSIVVYALGRDWWNPRAGLLAAATCLTSVLFLVHAHRGTIDALLTFGIVLSFYAYHRLSRQERPRAWIRVFWISCALGILLKGPVALLVPGLSILVHRLFTLGPRRAFVPRHELFTGLAVCLLVVGTWLAPAIYVGGREYAAALLLKQAVRRFASSWTEARPFWWHARTFPLGFLPWTLFLPVAARDLFRLRKEGRPGQSSLVASWFAVTFLFFSASSAKLERYLLPLYPAAALAIGLYFDRQISRPATERSFRVLAGLSAGLLAVSGVLLLGFPAFSDRIIPHFYLPLVRQGLSTLASEFAILLAVLGGVALASAAAATLRRGLGSPARFHASIAGGLLVVAFLYNAWFSLALDPRMSGRPAAEEAVRQVREEDLFLGNVGNGADNFYARRDQVEVPTIERLLWLGRRGRPYVLLVTEKWWRTAIGVDPPVPGEIVFRQPKLRGSDILVVVYRPPETPPEDGGR